MLLSSSGVMSARSIIWGLGWIVFPPADRSGHDRPAPQGLGQHFRRGAVRRKSAEDGELGIVHDNLCPFLAIVLFKLGKGLDDRHDLQAAGSGGREHHLGALNLRKGAILIAEEHTAVFQFPAHLICHGQDLPVELLDDQGDHEEGIGIFLRHDQEDGALLPAELLRINLCVKAQELLQLGIQKGIQPGQGCTHDAGHGLFGSIQSGPGKPFGFVVIRQNVNFLYF